MFPLKNLARKGLNEREFALQFTIFVKWVLGCNEAEVALFVGFVLGW